MFAPHSGMRKVKLILPRVFTYKVWKVSLLNELKMIVLHVLPELLKCVHGDTALLQAEAAPDACAVSHRRCSPIASDYRLLSPHTARPAI